MIPRPEHPKPQFMRSSWQNLNGTWEFAIDQSRSGIARELYDPQASFERTITVPFCPESELSGIGHKDFLYGVWYRRTVEFTQSQCDNRVVLHFGAVDYEATLWVNGKKVGSHKGGYVSFCFDITEFIAPGRNTITLFARDDNRDPMIPSGKQCGEYASFGCFYTRTTGIWQTVWLEFTPKAYIQSVKLDTDVPSATLYITAQLARAGEFRAEASFEGQPMGSVKALSRGGELRVHIPLAEKHLWELGKGGLYDLELYYGDDHVHSYFGLRSARMDGYKFLLNERSSFQRLVLDQGFYPDGIYTAPSDEALEHDIKMSMAMGFNGARLHEKVFEERFLYHADRLGYLVWGEYPNWGLDVSKPQAIYGILPEWLEEVKRDYNHPSIIGWCPFNETWDCDGHQQYDDVLRTVYLATKAADPGRPCIDTSGNFHVLTDIFDLHEYEQDVETFRKYFAGFPEDFFDHLNHRQTYQKGQPMFLSEYGGIRWTEDKSGWGYGQGPATEEEFLQRLQGLTDVLLDNPNIFGYCYTQLTDVEQEQNGLYTYHRKAKFPPEVIARILGRKAAIEE